MLYIMVVLEHGRREVFFDLSFNDMREKIARLTLRGCNTWCVMPIQAEVAFEIKRDSHANSSSRQPEA